MKRNKAIALVLSICAVLLPGGAAAQNVITRSGIDNPEKWINANFAAGKVPPFSFAYEEISSAKFITEWSFSKKKLACKESGTVAYIISYTNPEGTLRVSCDIKGYKDSRAVEWSLRFKNISRYNTSKIAVIKSADYKFSEPSAAGFTAQYLKGCNGATDDFQMETFDLRAGVIKDYAPLQGLSGKGESLPFYNIISRGADSGLALAVGWSGRWCVELRGVTSLEYKVFAGLENANFYLKPGEEVRTPLVATVFWSGSDPAAGPNALRAFIKRHHSPKVDGEVWTPLLGGFDFGSPDPCTACECLTDALARATVRRYSQFGIMPDALILDRGWNISDGDFTPKEDLFPDGFAALSRVVHGYGSRLMLRLDVERIAKGSPLAEQHKEFMLHGGKGYKYYIYDFSNAKAVDFICKYVGDMMENWGVDGLVCGIDGCNPAHYWDLADGVDRDGITEMKYIAGLWRFWDYIAARFPHCAPELSAAGERIDLETVSRSLVVRSRDLEENYLQSQGYYLSMFLPYSAASATSEQAYGCRSCTGGLQYIDFSLFSKGGSAAEMQKRVEQWRTIGRYFSEDYYPITGTVPLQHDDMWIVQQFHDKSSDSGIILAFRRNSAENITFAADFRGIRSDADYVLLDCDTDCSVTVSGRELQRGYQLRLDESRSSLLIKYKLK